MRVIAPFEAQVTVVLLVQRTQFSFLRGFLLLATAATTATEAKTQRHGKHDGTETPTDKVDMLSIINCTRKEIKKVGNLLGLGKNGGGMIHVIGATKLRSRKQPSSMD